MALRPFLNWVKAHKFASVLIAIFFLLVLVWLLGWFELLWVSRSSSSGVSGSVPEFVGGGNEEKGAAGTETSEERVVIEESNLSLVVNDVSAAAEEVVRYAEKEGGFLVSSEITSPEESPVATVVVRVPNTKLRPAVEYYRTLAVKVVEENIVGTDVTEEFQDLDSRIKALEETVAQFEAIKSRATKIADLVSITQQIITLREQIDALKGRKKFIADSAAFSRITVSLATDEFALPYQPPEGFRPGVIFKQAVRSLLSFVYGVAGGLIWVGVYAVVTVPILAFIWYLLKRFKRL